MHFQSIIRHDTQCPQKRKLKLYITRFPCQSWGSTNPPLTASFFNPTHDRRSSLPIFTRHARPILFTPLLLLAQDFEHVLWQARFADHATQNKTLKETKSVTDGASRAKTPHPAETARQALLSQRVSERATRPRQPDNAKAEPERNPSPCPTLAKDPSDNEPHAAK